MTGNLKYSHSLPITSEIIEYSQESIEANLNYSKYLNLCYQVIGTKERINYLLKKGVENISLVTSSLIKLHLVIESNLYTLLSSSIILTPNKSQLSTHFSTFLARGKTKDLPSQDYIDITSIGYNKTWGTEYGSLMYALHMIEEYEPYLSISQIEDKSSRYYLGKGSDEYINLLKNDILSIKYRDEIIHDENIYLASIGLINSNPTLLSTYEVLDFLSNWVPKIISWYIDQSEESNSPLKPFLINIAKTCLSHALDESNSKDLAYLFIHQGLNSNWYDVIPLLISYRNIIPTWDDSYEGQLVKELYQGIPAYIDRELLYKASDLLINNLPPGGYNSFLVLIASSLLHRAYILSHTSNPLVIKEDKELVGPLVIEQQVLTKRLFKLMYLAGYCLKKSSLQHIRILGGNLILLTKQTLPNRATSKNLLL
jgi:hypothetical protein